MPDLPILLERHDRAGHDATAVPIMPKLSTLIVSCLDARVDPTHLFGLVPGDAVVLRNAGGRVDGSVLRDVSMLRLLTSVASGGARRLEVVVVHHTDCGTARLADPGLAAAVGEPLAIDPAAVSALAVADPTATVIEDVELLRRTFDGLSVDGLVYDVTARELRSVTTGEVAA